MKMKKHQITTTLYDCNDDETESTKEGAHSIDMCDNLLAKHYENMKL